MDHQPQRTRSIGVLVVSLLALLVPLIAAPTASSMHPWSDYHWYRTGATISLTWRNQAGSSYATYINNALARWGSSQAGNWYPSGPARSDFSLSYTSGGNPSCTRDTDTANGQRNVTFCISYGENTSTSEAAIEFYTPSGSTPHIVSGLVWIHPNHQNNMPTYCHEAGHTFGLNHNTNPGSCLLSNPGTNQYPDQHDLDLSRTQNNGHTHSSTTTTTTTTTSTSTTTTTTWPSTTTTTRRCTVRNPLGGCLVYG